jgi:hypothetical protein
MCKLSCDRERSGSIPFSASGPTPGRAIDSIRVSNDGKKLTVRFDADSGSRIRWHVTISVEEEEKEE